MKQKKPGRSIENRKSVGMEISAAWYFAVFFPQSMVILTWVILWKLKPKIFLKIDQKILSFSTKDDMA